MMNDVMGNLIDQGDIASQAAEDHPVDAPPIILDQGAQGLQGGYLLISPDERHAIDDALTTCS